jgi:hypothetical protein
MGGAAASVCGGGGGWFLAPHAARADRSNTNATDAAPHRTALRRISQRGCPSGICSAVMRIAYPGDFPSIPFSLK